MLRGVGELILHRLEVPVDSKRPLGRPTYILEIVPARPSAHRNGTSVTMLDATSQAEVKVWGRKRTVW